MDAASALEASKGKSQRHGCRHNADIKGLRALGRTGSMLYEPPRLARLPEFNNPCPEIVCQPNGAGVSAVSHPKPFLLALILAGLAMLANVKPPRCDIDR